MNKIIVTGGCGFIGSHFCRELVKTNGDSRIVIIDKMGVGSSFENIKDFDQSIVFQKCDISKSSLPILAGSDVSIIYHFAAESHVDRSIDGPIPFVENNVSAMLRVLEFVREHPHIKLVNISTDEVYGALGPRDHYSWDERSPIAPNSPYSASKAACDMLCQAYVRTYGLKIVTIRCSNNFGTHQGDEKLIPTVVRSVVNKEPIPVYGSGENSREWVPVEVNVENILKIARNEDVGIFHSAGGIDMQNLGIIALIQLACQNRGYKSEIKLVKDRKGHDWAYRMDTINRKYFNRVDVEDFNKYMEKTVDYYISKYESQES
jgi:dTDP-glucose 4,6-dehydratase